MYGHNSASGASGALFSQATLQADHRHSVPNAAFGCWHLQQVKLLGDSTGRLTGKLGKDRAQRLGSLHGLVSVLDAAGIPSANLHTLGLLGSQSLSGSLRDILAL